MIKSEPGIIEQGNIQIFSDETISMFFKQPSGLKERQKEVPDTYGYNYSSTDSNTFQMIKRRGVVLIGATGSVGQSTLEVIREHGNRLKLVGIAAGSNGVRLNDIADEFNVHESSLFCKDGVAGLERIATMPEADIVLVASSGTIALRAVLAALEAGKDVALANKETLVVGGHLVKAAEAVSEGSVYPIDSEHNAIFQCLNGSRQHGEIQRLLLTASGGAFRDTPLKELRHVTVEDALRHPNWSMGPKITVDSATMANKGLELIEANWLFNVAPKQIEVVIHPQSIVHSMVEFRDNSIIAQLSRPSMTFAIQNILLYPDRLNSVHEALDFTSVLSLDFRPPDEERFPCLRLARESLDAGGIYPLVFNTANEVAVEAFLRSELPFLSISGVIADTLELISGELPNNVVELIEAEAFIGEKARYIMQKY